MKLLQCHVCCGYRSRTLQCDSVWHDDVIKWKHFLRYWRFVRRIHRSPVKSSHKGQWCGALMFSLICTRINGWVNNGEAGDLRRQANGPYREIVVLLVVLVTDSAPEGAAHLYWPMYITTASVLHFDGLVQERRNKSAFAMELRLSLYNSTLTRRRNRIEILL